MTKAFTHDSGGCNAAFYWGYISSYQTSERIIWVFGHAEFTTTGSAVIDDFGNLVGVK